MVLPNFKETVEYRRPAKLPARDMTLSMELEDLHVSSPPAVALDTTL